MYSPLKLPLYLNQLICILCGITILVSGGCSSNSTTEISAGSNSEKRLQIAFMPKGSSNAYWQRVHAGAVKAAQKLNVDIIWQDPVKQSNVDLQKQLVSNFSKRDIDALVLAPVCEQRLIEPVKNAVKKLPVIIIDSDLKENCYTSYVGTDNFAFGKQCAKELATSLNGTGNVLMLRFNNGQGSTMLREEGFMAGLKEYAPAIKLVSQDKFGGINTAACYQTSKTVLKANQKLDGIFTSNGQVTEGMLQALREDGRIGKVKLMGVDANELLVEALMKGEIEKLGIQDPFMMGYLGVKNAVSAIQKKKISNRVNTKIVMVSKENIQTPEIQELLSITKQLAVL